jgi:DNA-binding NarL/FixJ family response regulator
VLLDLELPGIGGVEVVKRLGPAHPEVEVLILTSFEDEERVYETIRAGASGYLVKGAEVARIVAAIQEVVAGGTVIEPRIARRFWNYFKSVEPGGGLVPPAPSGAPPPHDAAPAAPAAAFGLTDFERDLLQMIAKGLSNAEAGRVLDVERRTVRTHLGHIYAKMGVSSRVEAVVKALRAGVVTL